MKRKNYIMICLLFLFFSTNMFANINNEIEQERTDESSKLLLGLKAGYGFSGITSSNNIQNYNSGSLSYLYGIQFFYFPKDDFLGVMINIGATLYKFKSSDNFNDKFYTTLDAEIGPVLKAGKLIFYIAPYAAMKLSNGIFEKYEPSKYSFGFSTGMGLNFYFYKLIIPLFINFKMSIKQPASKAFNSQVWMIYLSTGYFFSL